MNQTQKEGSLVAYPSACDGTNKWPTDVWDLVYKTRGMG